MKDWSKWGVKRRCFPDYNYNAYWSNLETIRFGKGEVKELPADKAEFYDVALGTRCNMPGLNGTSGCPFCYVSATNSGRNFENVCEKAKFFFGSMQENERPFQIAIGSLGEPSCHPEFTEFLKTIYELGIVPNYTTNGITIAADSELSEKILDATEKYCAGVALSANTFNEQIDKTWRKALEKLSWYDVHINLHYIISDIPSVTKFCEIYDQYKDDVKYFVLLPLMNSGRSQERFQDEAFNIILNGDFDFSKIAFGAHFYDNLISQDKVKCWTYPPESYSKNLILDDMIKITPSSFNLNPIKEITWKM